jgi:hypothetical protein
LLVLLCAKICTYENVSWLKLLMWYMTQPLLLWYVWRSVEGSHSNMKTIIPIKYSYFYIFYKMLMQHLTLWEKQTCLRDSTMNSRLNQYKM